MTAQQTSVAAKAPAFAGMRSDASRDTNARSYTNEEASAEIPFGTFVGAGATNLETGMLQLAATADRKLGVLVNSMAFVPDVEVGDNGLKPKMTGSVDSRGRAWVLCEGDVTPADHVFIRCVFTPPEVPGSVRLDADTADAVDASPWARFLGSNVTGSDGNNIVEVEWDVAAAD